jgi:hypothetical protein
MSLPVSHGASTFERSAWRERILMCLAIPGREVDVVGEGNRLAGVEVAGVRRTVDMGLLDCDAHHGCITCASGPRKG